jgi:riboflavin biosynthesis pyrimidine reductase
MLNETHKFMRSSRFHAYCRRKEDDAVSAQLTSLTTVAQDTAGADLIPIGSDWTRGLFDGEFYRSARTYGDQLPSVSLFVGRSRRGHLLAGHELLRGGGETSLHLIHEGLSRVDADAVLASVGAANGSDAIFSVWHPELVALRGEAGHGRHPVQVVLTSSGELPYDDCLLFQEPSLKVVVVTTSIVAASLEERLQNRPWIEVLDAGEPLSLFSALLQLRARGLRVISAVGGRRTASALLRGGLVTDLYVTKPPYDHGDGEGQFYDGPPLLRRRLLAKTGCDGDEGVCFEHLVRPSVFASW